VGDIEIKGSVADIARLFGKAIEDEAKVQATRIGKDLVKEIVKRGPTAWTRFLKAFKFRKRKKNEANATYLGLRSKAASRAYKRRGKK
jgi:hypothetical protein